ncbi:malate dehydrogenase, mitochondrial-like [Atheta coriaria]|uniref:malate dehydrogenase, mitochondrial-like n=1 Tax=Dalotia coriaria TaxID=877792 RepID=UPI0031F4371C
MNRRVINIHLIKRGLRSITTIAHDKVISFQEEEKYEQKSCRVAVLGAQSTTGKALALLLKQNPLISQVYLHDFESTIGLAADLNHLDTQTIVFGFTRQDLLCALRNADIIVMLGLETIKADSPFDQKLSTEGKRIVEYATAAALHAPKAIFVDCVVPVSITLPIISEVYRRNHWYHPGKIVGSVSQLQMRLNSMLALHQSLDPACVHVPLLGGPEEDIVLPLFSRAAPQPMGVSESHCMINRFRKVDTDASPYVTSDVKHEYAPHGNAYAINRLLSTIALGLMGDSKAISTAFVRTNLVGACRHLVTTVLFGTQGITYNYGVPRLTQFELQLFERITLELNNREEMAKGFLEAISGDEQLLKSQAAATEALYFPATVSFCAPDDTIIYET